LSSLPDWNQQKTPAKSRRFLCRLKDLWLQHGFSRAYSNGCGCGVSAAEGGSRGRVTSGSTPVRVFRKATIFAFSASVNCLPSLQIKGLTLKEIANIRDTNDKTVRQQASSIYQKSGVNGRHGFSAWFIEDFL
jgi:hypothetical protein